MTWKYAHTNLFKLCDNDWNKLNVSDDDDIKIQNKKSAVDTIRILEEYD